MSRILLSASLVAAIYITACASDVYPSPELDALNEIIEHPGEHDGDVIPANIYPYDFGDSHSYALCFEPCDRQAASNSVVRLTTGQAGLYSGAVGTQSYLVELRFDARCSREPRECSPHVFYIFELVDNE